MRVLVTLPKNRANPLILYHLKLDQNKKAEKVGIGEGNETWRLYLQREDFLHLKEALPRLIQARTERKFETIEQYSEKLTKMFAEQEARRQEKHRKTLLYLKWRAIKERKRKRRLKNEREVD